MGHAPDYSLEVAHEIDEEVRKLIEAAHTEAWDVLNTYRDVLDNLVIELLDKETLQRKDLERIFSKVEKRPRITAFNEFGGRTPSDKPPIKTPGELAKERGEPWPPPGTLEEPEPTPVRTAPGAGDLPGGPPRPNPEPPGGNGTAARTACPAPARPAQLRPAVPAEPGRRPSRLEPQRRPAELRRAARLDAGHDAVRSPHQPVAAVLGAAARSRRTPARDQRGPSDPEDRGSGSEWDSGR